MLPLALPALAAASLALGQVTTVFRDGQSPAPGYAGTRDVAIHDGSRYAWNPDVNYDGLDDQAGGTPDNAAMLLRFDLSSVPAGTAIRSASLQVRVSTDSNGEAYPLYQCSQPWTSTGATWNRYDGVNFWEVPGAEGPADHGATTVAALAPTSNGFFTAPFSDAGVALAQGWIGGTIPNDGLIVHEYTNTVRMEVDRFGSSNPWEWPALVLELADGGTLAVDAGWDTTIASGRDPRTVNANGTRLNADGSPLAATLIAFDVSAIPPWSTVGAASLLLKCSDGTDQSYGIYESLRPWSETEATWNELAAGSPWGAPGADGPGDHGATVLGALTGGGALQVPLDDAGVQLVESWVRGGTNHGLEIVEYGMGSDGIWCDDREDGTVPDRPGLRVTYTEGELAFVNLPAAGGIGTALGPFTLQRRRLDGVPIGSGAPSVSMTATASSASAGFAATSTSGSWAPTWTVNFPAGSATSAAFWMRDVLAGRPTVTVSGGPAWRAGQQVESVRTVQVSLAATTAPAGSSVTATVQAVDSAEVTTAADLSARLVSGLPGGATFSATSVGTAGGTTASGTAPAGVATFTIQGNSAESLLFCASITAAPASEQCTPVTFTLGGLADHLHLSLARVGAQSPLTGCAEEGLLVELVDASDVPVSQAAQVTLCADLAGSVALGPSTLGNELRTDGCVSGTLRNDGTATLTVAPTAPAGVTFTADSPDVPGVPATLPVQWIAGPPSLLATGLAPRDGPEPLVLAEGGGPGHVRLTPRDECGFLPLTSPINLIIPSPLVAGSPVPDVDAGVVDIPVSMPSCPSVVEPLFVRALVSGRLLVREDGGVRTLQVEPSCPPRVNAVGCGCASDPTGGQGTGALLLAAALAAALARLRSNRIPAPAAPPRRGGGPRP